MRILSLWLLSSGALLTRTLKQHRERIRFAANVLVPKNVKQVIVRFHVSDAEPDRRDFNSPDAELHLVNEAGERWGGDYNDTISQCRRTTCWWCHVSDSNADGSFFYEPGRYNYSAHDLSCVVRPR
jgi:hypothetical protein